MILVSRLVGEIESEPPNNNLGKFEGNLILKNKTYPLKNDNVLLRGTRLRNTHWAYGSRTLDRRLTCARMLARSLVVCYAGPDTKLMRNSGKATFKRTKIDHLLNRIILGVGSTCYVRGVHCSSPLSFADLLLPSDHVCYHDHLLWLLGIVRRLRFPHVPTVGDVHLH